MDADDERIQRWLEEVSGLPANGVPLATYLRSGVVLCRLANTIRPNAIKKVSSLNSAYGQMENIKNFTDFLRFQLNMQDSEVFVTVDLWDAKNLRQVQYCLLQLAVRIKTIPGYAGPHLQGDVKSSYLKSEGPPSSSAGSESLGHVDREPTKAPPAPTKPAPKPPTEASAIEKLDAIAPQVRRTSVTRATPAAAPSSTATSATPASDKAIWQALSTLTSELDSAQSTLRELRLTDQHKSNALAILQSMIKMQDDKNEHFKSEMQHAKKEVSALSTALTATNSSIKQHNAAEAAARATQSPAASEDVAKLQSELAALTVQNHALVSSVKAAQSSAASNAQAIQMLVANQEASFDASAAVAKAHAAADSSSGANTSSAEIEALQHQLSLLRTQQSQSQQQAASAQAAAQHEMEELRETIRMLQASVQKLASAPAPAPAPAPVPATNPEVVTQLTAQVTSLTNDQAKFKKQNLSLREAMLTLQRRLDESRAQTDAQLVEVASSAAKAIARVESIPPPVPPMPLPPLVAVEDFEKLKKSYFSSRKGQKNLEESIEVLSAAFEAAQEAQDAINATAMAAPKPQADADLNARVEQLAEARAKTVVEEAMDRLATASAVAAAAANSDPSTATSSSPADHAALHALQTQLQALQGELRASASLAQDGHQAHEQRLSALQTEVAALVSSVQVAGQASSDMQGELSATTATLRKETHVAVTALHDEMEAATSARNEELSTIHGDLAWLREKLSELPASGSTLADELHELKLLVDRGAQDVADQLQQIRDSIPPPAPTPLPVKDHTPSIVALQEGLTKLTTSYTTLDTTMRQSERASETARTTDRDHHQRMFDAVNQRMQELRNASIAAASAAAAAAQSPVSASPPPTVPTPASTPPAADSPFDTSRADAPASSSNTPAPEDDTFDGDEEPRTRVSIAVVGGHSTASSIDLARYSPAIPEADEASVTSRSTNSSVPAVEVAAAAATPAPTPVMPHVHRSSSAALYAAEMQRMRDEYENSIANERRAKEAAETLLQRRRDSLSGASALGLGDSSSRSVSTRSSIDHSSAGTRKGSTASLGGGGSGHGSSFPEAHAVDEGDEEDGDSDSDSEDDADFARVPESAGSNLFSLGSSSSAPSAPAVASMASFESQLAAMKADFERQVQAEREMTQLKKMELLKRRDSSQPPTPVAAASHAAPTYAPMVVETTEEADEDVEADPARIFYEQTVAEGASAALKERMLPLINASRSSMALAPVGVLEAVQLQANLSIMRATLAGRRQVMVEESDEEYSDAD